MLNLYSNKNIQEIANAQHQERDTKKTQELQEGENKLFKTLLLLKKIEYGSYHEFFKAKVHHMDRKYWNEHYFEFEKTFGGKYFGLQIRDIVSKRLNSIERPRMISQKRK